MSKHKADCFCTGCLLREQAAIGARAAAPPVGHVRFTVNGDGDQVAEFIPAPPVVVPVDAALERAIGRFIKRATDDPFTVSLTESLLVKEIIALRSRLTAVEQDAKRWDAVETQALTIHCNYIGGDEAYTVTDHNVFTGIDSVYHGATPREAVDKFLAADATTRARYAAMAAARSPSDQEGR